MRKTIMENDGKSDFNGLNGGKVNYDKCAFQMCQGEFL